MPFQTPAASAQKNPPARGSSQASLRSQLSSKQPLNRGSSFREGYGPGGRLDPVPVPSNSRRKGRVHPDTPPSDEDLSNRFGREKDDDYPSMSALRPEERSQKARKKRTRRHRRIHFKNSVGGEEGEEEDEHVVYIMNKKCIEIINKK